MPNVQPAYCSSSRQGIKQQHTKAAAHSMPCTTARSPQNTPQAIGSTTPTSSSEQIQASQPDSWPLTATVTRGLHGAAADQKQGCAHWDGWLTAQANETHKTIHASARDIQQAQGNKRITSPGVSHTRRRQCCSCHMRHSSVQGMPSRDATGMTVGCRSPAAADAGVNVKRCVSSASTTRASSSAKCWPRQLRGPWMKGRNM